MANNTITVLNFTENIQSVSIIPTTSGAGPVASGILQPGQTSGFEVSTDELYNVYFLPRETSGFLTATNVAANSQVGVSITGGSPEEVGQVEAK
ncbi:MAG: hypothetical protein WCF57_06290 [Pyrinomonadaceae bacterium]